MYIIVLVCHLKWFNDITFGTRDDASTPLYQCRYRDRESDRYPVAASHPLRETSLTNHTRHKRVPQTHQQQASSKTKTRPIRTATSGTNKKTKTKQNQTIQRSKRCLLSKCRQEGSGGGQDNVNMCIFHYGVLLERCNILSYSIYRHLSLDGWQQDDSGCTV